MSNYPGVYYQVIETQSVDKKLPVFSKFMIKNDANVAEYVTNDAKDDNIITVKAYAIQFDSFEDDIVKAWTTVSAAANN